eukprot:Lankesteria_metandrocarpae@DN1908_c0_g1_i4.p2
MRDTLVVRVVNYSFQLDIVQKEIDNTVEQSLKVFEDKNALDVTVKGSLLPLISPNSASKKNEATFPSFRQKDTDDVEVRPEGDTSDDEAAEVDDGSDSECTNSFRFWILSGQS